MCGFVGVITPRSASRLVHRGPDGIGAIVDTLRWANVSMEMARLAVVDRRDIAVPFDFRASTGVLLAFNGEIYNWRALRAELSDGQPWQTECDAEVIGRAWRRWGVDMLGHFNGMFGLMLVDLQNSTVFLARDRAGEKPLYYAALGSGLAFASEIKALPIRFEETYCAELETLEFDCLETTPFNGVKCLGPGQYLLFNSIADIRDPSPVTWWQLPTEVVDELTWRQVVDQTGELLVDAIRMRAVSEVPVAVQLSGGLDSAIIQAVVKKERLYTVTFPDDGVDNLALARLASGGHELTPITFGLADLQRVLPDVVYHLDTPATWTAVCQWFMNKQMAADGTVVVLSGEGADEMFGGYTRYRFLWALKNMDGDLNLAAYAPMRRALFGDDVDIMARMLNRGGAATLDHARSLVERFSGTGDMCQRMARVDFATTMQVLLRMADRMAAAFSLENRSPFLDYRLMELAATLPTKWKIDDKMSKVILRAVASNLDVPLEIVCEKTKKGLFLPWARWQAVEGARGAWDRSGFAAVMRTAWRQAFFSGAARANASL